MTSVEVVILEFDAGLPIAEAGPRVDTTSEAWRHQCEVRSVARIFRERGGAAVRDYLADCAKHRSAEAVATLRADALKEIGR